MDKKRGEIYQGKKKNFFQKSTESLWVTAQKIILIINQIHVLQTSMFEKFEECMSTVHMIRGSLQFERICAYIVHEMLLAPPIFFDISHARRIMKFGVLICCPMTISGRYADLSFDPIKLIFLRIMCF